MNFLTDKDGTNRKDFEKLVLGILLILTVAVILFMYVYSHFIKEEIVWMVGALGTLFVTGQGIQAYTSLKNNNINNS